MANTLAEETIKNLNELLERKNKEIKILTQGCKDLKYNRQQKFIDEEVSKFKLLILKELEPILTKEQLEEFRCRFISVEVECTRKREDEELKAFNNLNDFDLDNI